MSSTRDSDAAPVDPPIPVPDVPGADATDRGLPRRIDLTLRQRLIVDSSAMADIALRKPSLDDVFLSLTVDSSAIWAEDEVALLSGVPVGSAGGTNGNGGKRRRSERGALHGRGVMP